MRNAKYWLGLLAAWSLTTVATMSSPHHHAAKPLGRRVATPPASTTKAAMPVQDPLSLLSILPTSPVESIADALFPKSGATPTTATGPRATGGLYLVVDMSGGLEAARWPVSYLSAIPSGGWQYEHKTAKLVLRRVEAGSFTMGSPSWEFGRSDDELQHTVVLTAPYYVGVFEFTQQQWMRVMSYNPSSYSGTARPVEQVGYEDIRGTNVGRAWPEHFDVDDTAFLGILRLKTGLAFDLPTEAQWEYACRAGTTSALNTGKDLTAEDKCPNMAAAGRYRYNQTDGAGGFTSAHTIAGSYPPNAWGLYDMHGNVEEWILDWYTNYPATTATNPLGGTIPTTRISRGGCWHMDAAGCRSAFRHTYQPGDCTGFRLACPVISTQKQIVTFDPNKGTCGTATQPNTILGVYETLPTDVSRPGYLFDGWFAEPDGEQRVYISSMVTTNTTRTLYAHWHPDIQHVTFDPNGGACNQTTQSYTVDTTYTPLPVATRPGYIFDGWFSAAVGGTPVTTESTVTTDLARTLYAHWTPDKQTVTFAPNGGTCDTQTATYTVDSTYSSLPVPMWEHYRFDGWFTSRWGDEAITASTTVTTDPERTFYAHWTRIEQVATFDPNGGSCSETERIYTVGQPYVSLPTATLEHYVAQWYTAPTGGDLVTESTIVPAIEYQTLHARWTRSEQIVTYDPNGGFCDTETQIQTIGQPYANLPTATLEHYALAGWYTERDGGDRVDGTVVPATDTCTLYAQWTRVGQIVTFDPNGGTCDTETQIQTIGQPYANLPSATLEHYTLAGWYTERDGGEPVDGSIVPATDTRTLYAHWTRVDQIVAFDPNGGNCDTENLIYTIGEPYTPLPDATREHYVLDGWYTHWSGGSRVDETSTVTTADTLTLYAHWRRVDQIITFNPNGGSCDTESHAYTIGVPYATLPEATREHYTLDGWYTQRNGGNRVDATSIVSATGALTLYAHWTRVDQIVTFDPNAGSCATETQIFTIGGPYSPLPDAYLEHYVLEGWYTSADGGELMDATTTVTESYTLTLYAHWKRGDQIVTFDPNGGTCAIESQAYSIGCTYSPLPDATREHYMLDGWYTDWSEGERILETNVVTADDTRLLHAHWKRLEAGSVQVVDSYQTGGETETTVSFWGYGGKHYALQRSQQLGDDSVWTTLDMLQVAHAGLYTFTTVPPPGWNSGFYRVVEMEESTQYLVVDMSGGKDAKKWPVSVLNHVPDGGWSDEYKTEKMVLRRIPMGSGIVCGEDAYGHIGSHTVTFTNPYYIGVFEVTQRQWELALGTRPSYFSNETHYATRPAECITYAAVRGEPPTWTYNADIPPVSGSFLDVLRIKTGMSFDLLDEMQWEYACRAGTTTDFNSGKDWTGESSCPNMAEVGRYRYNGGVEDADNLSDWDDNRDTSQIDTNLGTAKVGSYRPNAWGLYDMHGNVGEWCLVTEFPWDTQGWVRNCVQRGGSCRNLPDDCCSQSFCGEGFSGFRVCCPTTPTEYLVVDLSAGPTAESWPVSSLPDVPEGGWTDEYKTTKLVLRRIEAGTFMMGSPSDETGREDNETLHQVTLLKPYFIGVFEVTQKQWELVMGTRPSAYRNSSCYEKRPVESVSWDTIRGNSEWGWPVTSTVTVDSFMGRLRARTGLEFDLPTEAQWEYACRAGTTTALNSGKNLTETYKACPNVAEVGRYRGNCGWGNYGPPDYYDNTWYGTAEVGSHHPNAWGLYDMHGNVEEWCLDWYVSDLGTAAVTNPKGASYGSGRVNRGGSWASWPDRCRSAQRYGSDSSVTYSEVGFRLTGNLPE